MNECSDIDKPDRYTVNCLSTRGPNYTACSIRTIAGTVIRRCQHKTEALCWHQVYGSYCARNSQLDSQDKRKGFNKCIEENGGLDYQFRTKKESRHLRVPRMLPPEDPNWLSEVMCVCQEELCNTVELAEAGLMSWNSAKGPLNPCWRMTIAMILAILVYNGQYQHQMFAFLLLLFGVDEISAKGIDSLYN